MTILPELRDDLARARPILPELRDGLVTARRRRRRRPVLVTGLAVRDAAGHGGALAATGVIGIGRPRRAPHVNRDPARGVGFPPTAPRGCCRCGWPIRTAARRGACAWRRPRAG